MDQTDLELLETAREIVRDEHPAFNEGEVDAVVQEWKKNPDGHWISHELEWGQMLNNALDSDEPFSHAMGQELAGL